MHGFIFERGPTIFKVFKEHNLYRFVQIKVHWKTFNPFSPSIFSLSLSLIQNLKEDPEDTKWNVLYHTALRNYAAISLQVPSILSILLGPLSKYRGFSVYSINKTGSRRKKFITRANGASWLSSCSAPSQPFSSLFFGLKLFWQNWQLPQYTLWLYLRTKANF